MGVYDNADCRCGVDFRGGAVARYGTVGGRKTARRGAGGVLSSVGSTAEWHRIGFHAGFGHLSAGFLPRLHELCREQAAAPLSRAFSEHRAECGFALSEDEAALFSEFASGLGQEDSAGEVRRCDYYLSLWRARLSAAEDGLSANTRILRTLPLACGGLLILLFV